jgi:hypothetical protein
LVTSPYLPGVASRRHEAVMLAAKAGVEPRTAARWLAREGVQRASATLLELAAQELGIERDKAEGDAA